MVTIFQHGTIHLRTAFVYSVVVLGSPTNPQILIALTENSTLVEGLRSSNSYISSVALIVEGIPLLDWIRYFTTSPLLLEGAVHEMVMLVKVVIVWLKSTFPGTAVRNSNSVHN